MNHTILTTCQRAHTLNKSDVTCVMTVQLQKILPELQRKSCIAGRKELRPLSFDYRHGR